MARLSYDTSTVSPDEGRTLWQPGRYALEIVNADVKPNSKQTGEHVSVEFRNEDGRPFWKNYNVKHESAEAERIGRAEFAALHHAAGLPRLDDTDQLVGRRVELEIAIKKRKDTQEDENVVRGHYAVGSAPARAPLAQAKPATGGTSVPPWASGRAA